MPSAAMASTAAVTSARRSVVSGTDRPSTSSSVQAARMASGAPLQWTHRPSGPSTSTSMRLRVDVNGSSSWGSDDSMGWPRRPAIVSRAASVGSPTGSQRSPLRLSSAWLHVTAVMATASSAERVGPSPIPVTVPTGS